LKHKYFLCLFSWKWCKRSISGHFFKPGILFRAALLGKLSGKMVFTDFLVEDICGFLLLIICFETIDAAVVVLAARGDIWANEAPSVQAMVTANGERTVNSRVIL
jgi:hypothetical protein